MFATQMRAAIEAAPRSHLASLKPILWKGHAAGAIGDDDAQALAEAIEAKQRQAAPILARRRVGSRPRSAESLARRRRWVAAGLMPPQVACHFTTGEAAALAVYAAECAKKGRCTLTLGHVAALAGVCRSTVKNAVRTAVALGFIRSEEWRLSAWRNAPNTVTITSPEWQAWLRHRVRSKPYPARTDSSSTAHVSAEKCASREGRRGGQGTSLPLLLPGARARLW